MKHVEVQKQARITLSPQTRRELHIHEGDILAEEIKNGQIILTPVKLIDTRNLWFLSDHWKEGEREAEEDIQQGRLHGPFQSARDLSKALRK